MKATYHQAAGIEITLDVLATNADNTVDLGKEGKVTVSHCPVSTTPAIGCAVLMSKSEPDPSPLSKLTKDELLAKAAEEGVELDSKLTKAEIIAALEANKPS
jgi:hypothetical protein